MRFAVTLLLATVLIGLSYVYLFTPPVPPGALSISSTVSLGQLDHCMRNATRGLELKSECSLSGRCRPGKAYASYNGDLRMTVQQLLTGSELKVYSRLPLTPQQISTYRKCTQNDTG